MPQLVDQVTLTLTLPLVLPPPSETLTRAIEEIVPDPPAALPPVLKPVKSTLGWALIGLK